MSGSSREHRITHIGLCVSDLERSVSFYVDGLGFMERARLSVAGGPSQQLLNISDLALDMVYLEHSGIRIELLYYRSPGHVEQPTAPMNRLGFTHFSIRVDQLEPLVERIVRAGGSVQELSEVEFDGGNRGVMTLDPDGTRIELIDRVQA
jgi:catechol 2,3-dioxygenase-like lactoylglutathione lyase family enzyme